MRRELTSAGLGALYLSGLAPTVHVHDAGELTAAAWTLGLGHPPGAPLYMLLTKTFVSLVPFGHIAWRANLLSALLAVALFVLLASWAERRGAGPAEAIVVGAVAGLAPVLWSQALMAEVYTLQALLLAAVLVALDLEARPELIAFLWGLLLACHVGQVFLTPVLLVILVIPRGGCKERFKLLFRVTACVVLPLLLYSYVPIRALADPAVEWSSPGTLEELWWYLSNQNVRARSLSLPFAAYVARAVEYGGILLRNLHFAIPLALLGLFQSRSRRVAVLASLVVVFDGAFVVLLDTAPLSSEAYGIPAVVAAAMLVALGFGAMARQRSVRQWTVVLLAAAVLVSSWTARTRVDLSQNFVARDTAEAVLTQSPPGSVLFIQEDNTTFPLAYLIAVEGARPDLRVFDRAGNLFESPYDRPLHRIRDDLAGFRQTQEEPLVTGLLNDRREIVYSTAFLEFAPRAWNLRASGTVARVVADGADPNLLEIMLPLPRQPPEPDWMSRQILAMDAVRRAAADLVGGQPGSAGSRLATALSLADIAELDLQIAQLALQADDLETADAATGEAILREPGMAPAWSLRAQVALLENRLETAEELAGTALKHDSELAQAWLTLGQVSIQRHDWAQAESELTRALALGISGDGAWFNRALVRERRGDLGGAVADLEEAASRDPAGQSGLILVRMMARSHASVETLTDVLCRMVTGRPALTVGAEELVELLVLAARAGAPPCVDRWLQPVGAVNDERAEVVKAYLAAVGGRGSR